MSDFDDAWEELAAPLLTETFGGTALCTPFGGTQRTVTVTVWPEEVTEEQAERGIKRKHTHRLDVPRTAVAANGGPYLASPAIGDVWTIDGQPFTVEAIESQTPSETAVRAVRISIHEQSRENLRRRN
jgi:hypothetical protein